MAATGNGFPDLANLPTRSSGIDCQQIPVQLPRVIGVSAVGITQKLAFYSNYGFGAVDLTAPGGDGLIPNPLVTDTTASGQVLSTAAPTASSTSRRRATTARSRTAPIPSCPTYAYVQGTSFAAPHVTGIAALAISSFGKMTPEQLLVRMSLAANPLPCPPSPYDPLPVGPARDLQGAGLLQQLLRRGRGRRAGDDPVARARAGTDAAGVDGRDGAAASPALRAAGGRSANRSSARPFRVRQFARARAAGRRPRSARIAMCLSETPQATMYARTASARARASASDPCSVLSA